MKKDEKPARDREPEPFEDPAHRPGASGPAAHRGDVGDGKPTAPEFQAQVQRGTGGPAGAVPPGMRPIRPAPVAARVEGPDPHGAPARAASGGPGDEAVVAECLNLLSRITDPGSLAQIKSAVDGRVGPEVRAAKAAGHLA